ncbi:MAG: ABC transporter ATP-binding protein [Deltaproteobacteria bacterium]|nr:MAG: ABC transporter ATP-binding protein [Deltaproteobacteria bacterium]
MGELMDASNTIVRVENLVKDFRPGLGLRRKRVLHGISFEVQEGEIFGFVGPNGAGKTTTLKILMDLIRADEGRASILGSDVGETAFRRHVGYLPENPYFYDYLTGRELLHFYARLSGVTAGRRAGRVDALLRLVGLSHASDARLRTYSKGMLQRVGIAQALVHEPKVIFLDEPMSGLDPIGRKEVRDLILRLRNEGKTVFMSTHILPDVEMTCDRVAIIVNGRIRHESAIDQIFADSEREADLVLANLPPEIPGQLEEVFGVTLRGHGDRIEVRVREKDVQGVLQSALAVGAQVISVTPHRVSLESIFLNVVEEGSR